VTIPVVLTHVMARQVDGNHMTVSLDVTSSNPYVVRFRQFFANPKYDRFTK